jgi:protoporphyrin/coproporphyrin ferrochelatase
LRDWDQADMNIAHDYDAILVVSFGGPERDTDVMPFLENVTRGRNVPRERLLEVAEHYRHLGGKSPINDQCRALISALEAELAQHGPRLPIYWGNRNWHPFLIDTLRKMKDDGVRRALAFVTSAYSSYSGCRQYRENIKAAQEALAGDAPAVDKLRVFYNHPGFIAACAQRVKQALSRLPAGERADARLVFTAHSIPLGMAAVCDYQKQLEEACRLVAEALDIASYRLAYQSRSGPPSQPWLGPDVLDCLRQLHGEGAGVVVISPIGFISDHMEVLYDLDMEARNLARELGLRMERAETVGTRPEFISMIRELILERIDDSLPKRAIGRFGPNHDLCPETCCLPVTRPGAASTIRG